VTASHPAWASVVHVDTTWLAVGDSAVDAEQASKRSPALLATRRSSVPPARAELTRSARQAEDPLGDGVALDLRRPAGGRSAKGVEIPRPPVVRERPAVIELCRARSQQLDREALYPLVHLAPEDLDDRAVLACRVVEDLREAPVREHAVDLDLG